MIGLDKRKMFINWWYWNNELTLTGFPYCINSEVNAMKKEEYFLTAQENQLILGLLTIYHGKFIIY